MREVVIVGAVRIAIGKFGGAFASVPAVDLGSHVVRESLRRAGVAPAEVNELILGQVLQAGNGFNAARQVALKAGLPVGLPAYTVNKVCASGMKAVALAVQSVATCEHDLVVAGGIENMSRAPFLLSQARWGYRLGTGELVDSILSEALTDPLDKFHMGVTAENLAAEFHIDRRAQDEFAAQSQQKAGAAIKAGRFKAEIVPFDVPRKKETPLRVEVDEFPRPDTTADALGKLAPAFKKDGTVTAGNSSGINDGAAVMVVMSADEARRRAIRPMAKIASIAACGVEPARMGFGPVPATKAALDRAGLKLADLGAIELNEAFAAQSLAVIRALELDPGKVNLNGGAIALGHPVGASGARIIVTLLHLMAERQDRFGLATLCVGGGQGMAMIFANPAVA